MNVENNRKKAIDYLLNNQSTNLVEYLQYMFNQNLLLQTNSLQLRKSGDYSTELYVSCKDIGNFKKSYIKFHINEYIDILIDLNSKSLVLFTSQAVKIFNIGDTILEIGTKTCETYFEFNDRDLASTLDFYSNYLYRAQSKLSKYKEQGYKSDEEVRLSKTVELAEANSKTSANILRANKRNLQLSLLAILTALIFNWQSCNSTQKTIQTLVGIDGKTGTLNSNLTSVNNKMTELPIAIETYSNSLGGLNSTLKEQQSSILKATTDLNSSFQNLDEGIDQFENNLLRYNNQLDKIIAQTEEQLIIWKEQQQIIKDEYSRRPEIELALDECKVVNGKPTYKKLIIVNNGNIEAKLDNMQIYTSIKAIIPESKQTCFKKIGQDENYNHYQLICDKVELVPNQKYAYEFQFENSDWMAGVINYKISYISNYESKTIRNKIYSFSCKE